MNTQTAGKDATSEPAGAGKRPTRGFWIKLAVFSLFAVILVGGAVVIVSGVLGPVRLSGEAIANYVKSLGMWGHLAIVALMIVHSFLPFPAELVAIAAGICFGVVAGAAAVWIGAMIGALLAFGLARAFGRPLIEQLLPRRHSRALVHWSQSRSVTALIVVRLIPVIAFNLVNYAAGLTRVSWWTFIWTTALGIVPMTILMVAMGEQMRDPALKDWMFLVAAGLLIVVVVHVARRWGLAGEPRDS